MQQALKIIQRTVSVGFAKETTKDIIHQRSERPERMNEPERLIDLIVTIFGGRHGK